MADNTVQITEIAGNSVTATDIINAVTVTDTTENSVSVVAATFVNDAGASSKIYYGTTVPNAAIGTTGDFWIRTDTGELYGPRTGSGWPASSLPLIPKQYTHTQSSAATTWTVTHTLSGYPSVTVVDSAGTVVIGTVKYDSTSQITITFESAFSGKAYLT
jgi:hypothetical protein